MLATLGYATDYRISVKSRQMAMTGNSKPKLRPSQSQPVNAAELTKRLHAVLAEQKAHSERKRRAREDNERRSRTLLGSKRKSKYAMPATIEQIGKVDSSEQKQTQPAVSSPEHRLKISNSNKVGGQSSGEDQKPSSSYHHVPQVAASQFALTTTVDSLSGNGPIHRLSKAAMKFHLDGLNASREMRAACPTAPPCEQTKALRRAQSMRERQYDRNQVHDPLPTTLEVARGSCELPERNAFQGHLRLKQVRDDVKSARRKSTGSIVGRSEAYPVDDFELPGILFSSTRPAIAGDPDEHRVDWSQSDEAMAIKTVKVPHPPRPELRKPETKWTLRGRLGSFGRHSKEDKMPSPTDEKPSRDQSPTSPISGFLGTTM